MSEQPKEYIIDGEYIEKLYEWLGEDGIDELQRMQIRTRLKLTPNTELEEYRNKLYKMCECVPLKEFAPDYDKGFHQAMSLVRGWIDQHSKQDKKGNSK
jgi:hypothetical protein